MMEKQDDILLKVRSHRGVTAAAYRLYTTRFRQMMKAEWMHVLDTAIVTTAVGMLTVYGLYLFVPLAIVALLLEGVLWLMVTRWLTKRPLRSLLRPARRHWLRLLGVVIGWWIALLPFCLFVSLPLLVLIFAEWDSQNSALIGDPLGMPAYMPYLMAATWLITTVLQLCIRLLIVYVGYYAWGSAEARRREREQQKLSIQ